MERGLTSCRGLSPAVSCCLAFFWQSSGRFVLESIAKAVTLFDGGRDEMVLSVVRLEVRAKKRRLCFAKARKTAARNSYRTNYSAEEYELDPRFRGVRDLISCDEFGKSTADCMEMTSQQSTSIGNAVIFPAHLVLDLRRYRYLFHRRSLLVIGVGTTSANGTSDGGPAVLCVGRGIL